VAAAGGARPSTQYTALPPSTRRSLQGFQRLLSPPAIKGVAALSDTVSRPSVRPSIFLLHAP